MNAGKRPAMSLTAQRLSASSSRSRGPGNGRAYCAAQRLSASSSRSRLTRARDRRAGGCSTPFGVIVEVTLGPAGTVSRPRLLNAFRRHRRGHGRTRRRSVRVGSAQRLRRHRRGHGTDVAIGQGSPSAQRLRRHRRGHGPRVVIGSTMESAQRLSASSSR